MEELSDLMQEQQNINLPENELQWKVWLVPNFNETQSIMIWKSHHVIGDGLGVMILLSTL
jgi:hypothetical protein